MTEPHSPEPQPPPAAFGQPQPTAPQAFAPVPQPSPAEMAIRANFGVQPQEFHGNPLYAPVPPTAPQLLGGIQPPPVRRGRAPLIVLAVLFVVALAAASTMLVGYLNERGTIASFSQQLDQRQRSLTDTNRKLADTNKKLATANAHVDQLNAQINNLTNQVNTLTTSNTGLNTCVTAFKTFIVLLNQNPNAPSLDQLARNADNVCGF